MQYGGIKYIFSPYFLRNFSVYKNVIVILPYIIQSMSRKGNCWDNAVSESFFHTLKVELVHQVTFKTREEAKQFLRIQGGQTRFYMAPFILFLNDQENFKIPAERLYHQYAKKVK